MEEAHVEKEQPPPDTGREQEEQALARRPPLPPPWMVESKKRKAQSTPAIPISLAEMMALAQAPPKAKKAQTIHTL